LDDARLAEVTFLNALSKSFGSFEAPTSFAIAMKRAWRWESVSFGFAGDLLGMLHKIIQNGRFGYG
jgi:hypothetical protein